MSDFSLTFRESPMGWKCPALQKMLKRFGELPAELGKIGVLVTREIEKNLSGQLLNRRSGKLWSSWQWEVSVSNSGWRLAIGSDVVYARIHEFGGMTGRGHKTQIKATHYVSKAVETTGEPVRRLIHDYLATMMWT
jgi:phage gpG-like protein